FPILIGLVIPFLNEKVNSKLYLSYILIFLSFTTIVLSIALHVYRVKTLDVFSPFLIPNILFTFIYIFKPLYIILTQKTGVGTFDLHYLNDNENEEFIIACLYTFYVIVIYNGLLHYLIRKKTTDFFDSKKNILIDKI
ncbi:hypothetical protein, partial [Kitasatospora sp. SC0581]|uniref:hypothetical protein n=1 Tax=Kitasatospora sp. SC0581 TaxID=3394360 RepID=UPI003A85D8F2